MGNRHANKQLRRAVRARMALTGESYQQAHASLRLRPPTRQAPAAPRPTAPRPTAGDVDLLSIRYFGVPSVLATFEIAGRLSVLVLSNPFLSGPLPLNPLLALGSRRSVHWTDLRLSLCKLARWGSK